MEELAALVVASAVEDLVVGTPQATEGRAEGLDGHVRAEHAAVAAEDIDHPPEPRADRLDVPRSEDRTEGIEAGGDVRTVGQRSQRVEVYATAVGAEVGGPTEVVEHDPQVGQLVGQPDHPRDLIGAGLD